MVGYDNFDAQRVGEFCFFDGCYAAVDGDAIGVSTTGSSEAVMLGGLAMKWQWRKRREAAGQDGSKPNLILGSNVQVVWEKFCRYWDVEPRYLPMERERYVITPEQVANAVDENTIGVVAILGTTYTGEFEPIKEIHDTLVKLNAANGWEVPLHVDGASGAFVAPFLHPELAWDFRLPLVKSINASGHKYGLVYPGVGWVMWRSHEDLPEELVFHVNYLGGDMPTFTLNFSRAGNQVVGQYYNFLRLGRAGYTVVMETLRDIATWLSGEIAKLGPFELISDGSAIPVFAVKLRDGLPYSVYDLSDKLRQGGWQVPAYTMPEDAEDVEVLRVVVREGFSRDLADELRATKDELEADDEEQRLEIDRLTRENYKLRANARWPEWITGAGIVLVGMALGALLGRNAGRRRQPRVRL